MPAQPVQAEPPFVLSVYSIASNAGRRQLLVIQTEHLKTNLLSEAFKIGGQRIGDWIALPTDAGVDDLDKLTSEMGGIVYDLFIRPRRHG